jgi:quinol monooxygenase YgiN
MASPAVSTLISLFGSDPTLLLCAPKVHNLHPAASFTRPEISGHENPYIVFATLDYKSGTRSQGVAGFSQVCEETEKNEKETLSYSILEDKENDNLVKTLEVYESEKYLWDPHAKSQAVSQNKEMNGGIRNSTSFVFLKRVAGFLWKADVK